MDRTFGFAGLNNSTTSGVNLRCSRCVDQAGPIRGSSWSEIEFPVDVSRVQGKKRVSLHVWRLFSVHPLVTASLHHFLLVPFSIQRT